MIQNETKLYQLKVSRTVEQVALVKLPASMNSEEVESWVKEAIKKDALSRYDFRTVSELEIDADSLEVNEYSDSILNNVT
jgi:hypothetical protein